MYRLNGSSFVYEDVRIRIAGDAILVRSGESIAIYGIGEWFEVYDLSLVLYRSDGSAHLFSEGDPSGVGGGDDEMCRRLYLTQFRDPSLSVEMGIRVLISPPIAASLVDIISRSPLFTVSQMIYAARDAMGHPDPSAFRVSRWLGATDTELSCRVGRAGIFVDDGAFERYVPFNKLPRVYPLRRSGHRILSVGWGAWSLAPFLDVEEEYPTGETLGLGEILEMGKPLGKPLGEAPGLGEILEMGKPLKIILVLDLL